MTMVEVNFSSFGHHIELPPGQCLRGGSYLFTDEETDSNLCSSEWYWKIQAVISSRFFCDIVRKCCCSLKASRLRRSPAYWILLNFQLVVPSGLARGCFLLTIKKVPPNCQDQRTRRYSLTRQQSQLHPHLGMVSPNFRPSGTEQYLQGETKTKQECVHEYKPNACRIATCFL
ncbi:hypothetical protein SLE2022_232310 [Rubroshorea leprosula]